jgi:phosphate-selective porin OprO/OprP
MYKTTWTFLVLAALGAPLAPASAKEGIAVGSEGIQAEIAGGKVKLRLGGKLQIDALRVDDNAATSYTDVAARRARLDFRVEFANLLTLRAEREFAGSKGWRNLYAALRPAEGLLIQGGQFNAPFSMEDMQSSASIPFAERSLAASLTAEFGLGGQVGYSGRRFTARAGYFENALNRPNGPAATQGRGVSARLTLLPVDSKRTKLHLGLGADRRSFRSTESIRYSAEAGSTFGPRILRTPALTGLANRRGYNAELALLSGPLMAQGQYIRQDLNSITGGKIRLVGGYAQTGWVVTGQPYKYARGSGVISGPDLERKSTALELAARFSRLDADNSSIDGGAASSIDLSANLYFGKNVRLTATGSRSHSRQLRALPAVNTNVALTRLQLVF